MALCEQRDMEKPVEALHLGQASEIGEVLQTVLKPKTLDSGLTQFVCIPTCKLEYWTQFNAYPARTF